MSATVVLPDVAQRATRRIARRLLPFLFVLYVIAFLDRVNVGYAGLEMSRDLHFSDKVFGLGAGIFSIGYFLFEIPGALIVERWSARKWIARILVSWGLVTILMAAVHTPRQFYLARFLLGVAEAGFFPGIVVYLTHWFRYQDRAKAGAIFPCPASSDRLWLGGFSVIVGPGSRAGDGFSSWREFRRSCSASLPSST
jgi:ACS family tartrate transporter-like MFS transporter